MKVIELIRKLFAKAESAREIGSADEAAAFAAKASELLLRHKLDMSDIELQDEGDTDPFGMDRSMAQAGLGGVFSQKWSRQLVSAVATANFCKAIFETGRSARGNAVFNRVTLVGRENDRQIASYLITVLHREAKRLAREAQQQSLTGWRRFHRPSFLLGFVAAVHARLNQQRREVKATGQYAVVRIERAEEELNQYTREAYGATSPIRSRSTSVNSHSYNAGKDAGSNVGLGGIGGPTVGRLRLSA